MTVVEDIGAASWATETGRAGARQALGALSVLVPAGIVAVDADGQSWYHNQRWEDVTGAVGVEFRGRPWFDAVHPEDRSAVATQWRAQSDGRGRFGTFRVVSPDGTVRTCAGQTVAVMGTGDQVEGYLILCTDLGGERALSSPHLVGALLDRSNDNVTILNRDGSWRWSSGGAVRFVGYQPDFDPRDGFFHLLHPDDRAAARRQFERVVHGTAQPNERPHFRVRAADGSWRWMEVLVDARLDDPIVDGVIVHAWDVTELRESQAALAASNLRLRNLIDRMDVGVVVEDVERRVILANQAFFDIFRITVPAAAVVGRTLAEAGLSISEFVVNGNGAEQEVRHRLSAQNPTPRRRDVMLDGRTIEWGYVPLHDSDSYQGHIWLVADVTDQARADAERERLLASAQQENQSLAELAAHRSEVLASVSHELRTPLTSIVGHAQMLREVLLSRQASEEAGFVDVILRNVNRLFRLNGDLLVLDSLEQRILPLDITRVDLRQVVEEAVAAVQEEAAAGGLTIATGLGSAAELIGDRERLAQMVDSLLSNAVKFSLPGGHITVSLDPAEDRWRITVTDTGIGIPATEQAQVCQRFFRASNAQTRGVPGQGLGLAMALAIAEIHGGTVTIQSELGRGTTVIAEVGDITEQEAESGA